jgi:ubiquinone/menaquinone biosynthesis C-methylase UbiE
MHSEEAINTYSNRAGLYPIEDVAFSLIQDEFKGQPILDLGVGGGRTTPYLKQISTNYTGVDYAKGMIEQCQQKYPGTKFIHADACDLSLFPDESFALIIFSNEGICMVGHEDRSRIISEAKRLLKPSGVFLFSSYNQDSDAHNSQFKFKRFDKTFHPFKLFVRTLRYTRDYIKATRNRRYFKRLEVRKPEYSIINDTFHLYSTLLYYISINNQKKQLNDLGFKQIQAISLKGITQDSCEKVIYYLCR